MHRAILIDPGFLGEYGIGKWGKAYWSSAINHGIAQISGILKDKGIDCSLIDFRMIKSYEEFRRLIKKNGSCWYCITCRTIDYPVVNKAIQIIREEVPNAKVVVGGIHANLCSNDFINNDLVDYVFLGEADVTLPDLIFNSHSYPKLIKGHIPNIDNSPFEDIEIYNYKTSISFSLYGGIVSPPMIPIITSRGCVYNCKFCQPAEKILYGEKYRQKSVDRVIDELKYISSRYNFRSIMFYDDCLLAHKKYLFKLLSMVRDIKKVDIMLQGRADNVCNMRDDIGELRKLGLKTLIVGFESGSQRVLDFIGKRTTVEQNLKAAEILNKYGVKIVGNFMVGLPTETNDEIQQTIFMAERIRPTIASCSFYSPMPGSYIYEYCKENDLIIQKDYAHLSRDPRRPKLYEVDYEYATEALYKIVGSRFRSRIIKRMVGYAYKNLERGVFREVLSKIYNKILN